MIKLLFFKYQKVMFYVAQAKGEYGKVGSFIPETLAIMTYLSVKGIDIKWWFIPIGYALIILIAAIIGKILDLIGVVRYNQTLGNKRNEELQAIIQDLQLIKERLRIK